MAMNVPKVAVWSVLALGSMLATAQAQRLPDERPGLVSPNVSTSYQGISIRGSVYPTSGAIPEGEPYDPYRLPYTYDWPYGYGYKAR